MSDKSSLIDDISNTDIQITPAIIPEPQRRLSIIPETPVSTKPKSGKKFSFKKPSRQMFKKTPPTDQSVVFS